jgi:hypothetical protein
MSKWNTANVARAGRACLAGFALVILSASLAEATYGPRTKIGANYQQTSSTTSPNGSTAGSCNTNVCYVLFQVPPAQKSLIVQHVSCRVRLVSGGEIREVILRTRKGQDFPRRSTFLVPVPTSGDYRVVNSPVMHLVESGERPQLFIHNSQDTIWVVDCSISGKLQ